MFGALFSLLIWIFAPDTKLIYLGLVFFASFLIDFDHYVASVLKTGKLGLGISFEYHRKMLEQERKEKKEGIRRRGDFHFFHTIEFHVLIGLLGLVWVGFFYVFIGMVFHSLIDLVSIMRSGVLYRREFLLFNWIRKKI